MGTPLLTLQQLVGQARALDLAQLIQLIAAVANKLQAREVLQAAAEAERQEELDRTPCRRAQRRPEAPCGKDGTTGKAADDSKDLEFNQCW